MKDILITVKKILVKKFQPPGNCFRITTAMLFPYVIGYFSIIRICFFIYFFCQLMSQLTAGAGEGRGAIHDSFHRAVTHSRRARC